MVEQFLLEALGPQCLAAPPAAGINDDFAMLVVDGQGLGIGFDGRPAADVAGWDAVTVAVELEAQILCGPEHRRCRGNPAAAPATGAAIRKEALVGTCARLAVESLIGNFVQPRTHLTIHVSQTGEYA